MCGISGCYLNQIFNLDILISGAKLQHHRGPDNFGYYNDDKIALFHNRLSIIDLSDASNQPYEKDNYVLVFNGEIYNYKELYKKYFGNKEIPKSDTIVLFDLLIEYKDKIIPELNGMFAFALYNKIDNTILLGRDRTGIKPLYYYSENNNLFFASEIKTVLSFLKSTIDFNQAENLLKDSVDDLFAIGHLEYQKDLYKGIHELKPGHYMFYDCNNNTFEMHCYFNYSKHITKEAFQSINKNSEIYLIDKLDSLLNESIKIHLISDAKIGSLCSGGIDSSLITAIALKYNPNISIFHAGVRGGGGEEEYAELVAQHLGINIEYIYMEENEFLETLPAAIYHSDFPTYHPNDISLFSICNKSREHNIKVLLCGEGADELFGGYSWHKFFNEQSRLNENIEKGLKNFNKLLNKLKMFIFRPEFNKEDFINYTPSYLNYSNANIPNLAKRNSLIRNTDSWNFYDSLISQYKNIANEQEANSLAFISNNLGGHLSSVLHRNDRMGMMASIETRVPFLENEIIDFALNLELQYKINNQEGKYLLKKVSERYIPMKNIYRAKAGFPVPYTNYLSKFNHNLFENGFLINYLKINKNILDRWIGSDSLLLFQAMVIEIWGRIFIYDQDFKELQKTIIKK